MKLTKEQIDEIVKAAIGGYGPITEATVTRNLTRAFGEPKNPWDAWRGCGGPAGHAAALFDAAAKVADGVGDDGVLLYTRHDHEEAQAALKRIVEEIRGMA